MTHSETMVEVGGGDVVWLSDGGGDRPPLVLLHPGVGDSRVWDPLLPGLTDYRVIRYDARGYGRSPAPTAAYSLLGDLITVLDHLDLPRVPIVGCSQGGGSALALAITQPSRVSALVLLCPGIPGYPVPPGPPSLEAEFDKAATEGPEAIAEIGLRLWAAAGRTPEVEAQLLSAARAWLAQGDFEQPDPPVWDRLGEIGVPTALLVGDADRDWLLESNRQAAGRIPEVTFVEVPGVDHLPSLRVPDRVLDLIRETVR